MHFASNLFFSCSFSSAVLPFSIVRQIFAIALSPCSEAITHECIVQLQADWNSTIACGEGIRRRRRDYWLCWLDFCTYLLQALRGFTAMLLCLRYENYHNYNHKIKCSLHCSALATSRLYLNNRTLKPIRRILLQH